MTEGGNPDVDAVVVGAGFAGLYMLHRLRTAGFTSQVIEAAPAIGGTWYWNCYPGARCDIESVQYSFQFSDELQQEWNWSERYASQPELLAYINHVADRFDLRRDITLSTRVDAASWLEDEHLWLVRTDDGAELRSRFVVLGTGCLSTTNQPRFEGQDSFEGAVLHTGRWPQDGFDVTGKRVGVIGTGSSAVQSIPLLAEDADHLVVFQRTANYVVPARNHPLTDGDMAAIKADYDSLRARSWARPSAFLFPFNPGLVFDVDEDERRHRFDAQWEIGGLPFLGAFGDLLTNPDANLAVTEYWKSKLRELVDDPAVAELLIPDGDIFGGKRLCAGTDYYETYNRDDVTLVDVSGAGVERFTPTGLVAEGRPFELDVVVCATGFDAMTGSVVRMDISGVDGQTIKDRWSEGCDNYLGLSISGFPNLFNMAGPGSPSVFATMVTGIEHQGDWIAGVMSSMRSSDVTRIEADPAAEQDWVAEVDRVARASLRSRCGSWYNGANIEGKASVFMPYIGGFPTYVDTCQAVVDNDYEGFVLDRPGSGR